MTNKIEKTLWIKKQGASQASQEIGKIGSASNKATSAITKMVKSAVGIGAIVMVAKKAGDAVLNMTKASIAQEEIYNNLAVTMDKVGVSYEENKTKLDDLFASQQAFTKYGDTESAMMLDNLIELSGNYKLSVENLALAQDMATSRFFTNETASKYLGMALAGNVEMLGRYVPELRTTNEEFANLKTQAEKTEYALKLLNEKYGGKAREQMDSVAQKIVRMKNYWGDYQEMLGDKVTPAIGKASDAIAEFFARATETDLDTTIRQLKEMGAEMGDIEELVLVNNLLKADEELEKIGNQFEKA